MIVYFIYFSIQNIGGYGTEKLYQNSFIFNAYIELIF